MRRLSRSAEGRRWLEDAGATCVEVSLHTKYALPTYYIIAPASVIEPRPL